MRLRKVGDWIEYCTEMGQTFYYNEETGDFQWVDPNLSPEEASSAALQLHRQNQNQHVSHRDREKASGSGPTVQSSGAGESTVYSNRGANGVRGKGEEVTVAANDGHSAGGWSSSSQGKGTEGAGAGVGSGESVGQTVSYDRGYVDGVEEVAQEESEDRGSDLEDWRAYRDQASGYVYWYNSRTNVSQWECPQSVLNQRSRREQSRQLRGRHGADGSLRRHSVEQDVREVYTDEDLGI